MATSIKSPRGSRHKRSYLDKGPSKEQVERRNFLKGKLGFDDDDSYSGHPESHVNGDDKDDGEGGYLPLETRSERKERSFSARRSLSRSLSPKSFGLGVLGRRERPKRGNVAPDEPGTRSMSNVPALSHGRPREEMISLSPNPVRRRVKSGLSRSERTSTDEAPVGVKTRSLSNASSMLNGMSREEIASMSPKPVRRRVKSGLSRSERTSADEAPVGMKTRSLSNASSMPNGMSREEIASLSPSRIRCRLKSGLSRSERTTRGQPDEGFDNMRQSLIADKKHLDNLQSQYEHSSDDEPVDDETLLERVARRVAARRGKMNRSKTDGEGIASMQEALRRRQEMDQEQDEQIGGLWAMGLKALEKVYDDLNTS